MPEPDFEKLAALSMNYLLFFRVEAGKLVSSRAPPASSKISARSRPSPWSPPAATCPPTAPARRGNISASRRAEPPPGTSASGATAIRAGRPSGGCGRRESAVDRPSRSALFATLAGGARTCPYQPPRADDAHRRWSRRSGASTGRDRGGSSLLSRPASTTAGNRTPSMPVRGTHRTRRRRNTVPVDGLPDVRTDKFCPRRVLFSRLLR